MELKRIKINNVIFGKNNPRKELGDVSDLVASIKAVGLISPLTVRWNITECKYEVVAGNRRLKALQDIKAEEVDVIVNNSEDDELFALSTAENINRKEMSPVDECRAIKSMVDGGKDVRTVATTFGHSVRWAMGRLKMAELGDEILDMVDEGDITLAHAEVLTMCSSDDEVKKFSASCRNTHPEDLKKRILNEKKNLAKAPFDVKKNCKNCRKQTICQQDIFGDVTDSYCEDGDCFQKHLDSFLESKRQELKKNGYREYEGSWEWGFKNSRDYIDPDKMSEDDIETVERIKANGGRMWFMLKDDGTVTFRWSREEAPEDPEEEEAKEQEREERDLKFKVQRMAGELEREAISKVIERELYQCNEEIIAIVFDYVNSMENDCEKFSESTVDDDRDEHDEGAVANVGPMEKTLSGKTQREYLLEKLLDNLFTYGGECLYKSEAERAFFKLKPHDEYERQARELIENEPEEETEEGEEE